LKTCDTSRPQVENLCHRRKPAMSGLRTWINEGPGRWVTICACVLLIAGAVAAAIWLVPWSATEPRAKAIRRRGLQARYVCKACGRTGEVPIAFDQKFPIPCPHCGKLETARGFNCVKCRRIIAVQRSLYYRCPHRDCNRVYDYRIGGAGQAPGR
jgi:DNA-directed RNA polymerase subunit RPC12/RpoP